MVTKQERANMMNYLVGALEQTGEAKPSQTKIRGKNINYIKTEGGIVLLLDQKIGGDQFREVHNLAKNQYHQNVATVAYKDGKTFFRSSASSKPTQSKICKMDKSLKNYNFQDMRRMIDLNSEEKIFTPGAIQYYQPETIHFEEGVISYKFNNVKLDYSHINPDEKFKPENTFSKTIFIWDENEELFGDLMLSKGKLIERITQEDNGQILLGDFGVNSRRR